jgi:SAM-dependent methyltransferase
MREKENLNEQSLLHPHSKKLLKRIWNLLGFPLRISLPYATAERFGFSSTRDERISVCLPYCRGRLLDVGCGDNLLVHKYGNGIGVDVWAWKGVDVCVDTCHLPFDDEAFDTITFLASLNHIPQRVAVLQECYRLLKPTGRLLISMIGPVVGWINHRMLVGWWDPDIHERGVLAGEVWGISQHEVRKTIEAGGFTLDHEFPFFYHINRLYIARK